MAFAKPCIAILIVWSGLVSTTLADEKLAGTAIVATKVVYSGQMITRESLKIVRLRKPIPMTSEYAIDYHDVVGKLASSTLLPNRLISLSSLSVPPVVNAGDYVRIIYEATGLIIYIEGTSLSDGAVGEIVTVRNNVTGKNIFALVINESSVKVIGK